MDIVGPGISANRATQPQRVCRSTEGEIVGDLSASYEKNRGFFSNGCGKVRWWLALPTGGSLFVLGCRVQKHRSGREVVLVNRPTKSIAT